jgi:probable addiction module antidote protein
MILHLYPPSWVISPEQTGLARSSLYKALSPNGNPEFATILKVIKVLGLKLRATTAKV